MRKTATILLLILTATLYSIPKDYWNKIEICDYDHFKEIYNSSDEDSLERGYAAYGLFETGDYNKEFGNEAIKILASKLESNDYESDEKYHLELVLSELYLNSIIDAKTWMDYGNKLEKLIASLEESDSSNIRLQISASKSMMWFPNPRGSNDKGEEIFNNLLNQYPENPLVLVAHGNLKLGEEEYDKAEELFTKALSHSPNNGKAIKNLEEMKLAQKNLEIRDIYIKNSVKTSGKRILKKVEKYKGEDFNFTSKSDINSSISKISSIGGATIKGIEVEDGMVDLELTISEDNTRILAAVVGGPVSLDKNNKPLPGLMGAVMYMDNNLFGTGLRLQYVTAAVFNQLTITKPGLINDGVIDLRLSGESMLYPGEVLFIEDGEPGEKLYKATYNSAEIGLGREFPIGALAFLNYKAKWNYYKQLGNNKTPSSSTVHEIRGDFAFKMAGDAMSGVQTLNGFNFMFTPKMIYKGDYRSWGDPSELYTHDNKPAWMFTTNAAYHKNLGDRHNVVTDISWFASMNPYQSDRFALGPGGNPMAPASISGCLPGEFLVDNALLGNLKYTFIVSPNKLNLYTKYDILYDIDEESLFNGCAIGMNSKLPWDLDIIGEVGIGFNADRDNMPGFHLALTMIKMYAI